MVLDLKNLFFVDSNLGISAVCLKLAFHQYEVFQLCLTLSKQSLLLCNLTFHRCNGWVWQEKIYFAQNNKKEVVCFVTSIEQYCVLRFVDQLNLVGKPKQFFF